MRYLLIGAGVVFALVLARMALFTVDRTEFVYLTQFGRHIATYDGANEEDAGLHFCFPWPIQSVQRLDRRLQYFDLPGAELLTHDAEGKTIDKTLIVDAYVCWRIQDKDKSPDAVDRFIRGLGTLDYARSVLGKRINGQVGAAIGQMGMDDLVSTDLVAGDKRKVEVKMEQLRQSLLQSLQTPLAQDYGIELVDLRLRRFNHPAGQVREAIFDRIRSERDKKVQEYLSEGKRKADDIRSQSKKEVSDLKSQADAEARIERGKAESEADRIRTEAHAKDPEFYAFLKRLEVYQNLLGEGKGVLLLSAHRPLFEQLFNPPQVNGSGPNGGKTPMPGKQGGDK